MQIGALTVVLKNSSKPPCPKMRPSRLAGHEQHSPHEEDCQGQDEDDFNGFSDLVHLVP
jgi:hypothetical protein